MKILDNIKGSITTKLSILVIIPWIALAIVFGFTDLEISKVIVNSDSLWGKTGRDYAYIPAYTMIAISFAILIGSNFKDLKKQKIFGNLINLYLFEIIYGYKRTITNLIAGEYWYVFLKIYFILGVIIFSIVTLKKDWKEFIQIAFVILLLTIFLTLFVDVTKQLCGRVRFKDLNSNYSNYTPWFLPPGPNSPHRSFPSGHTAQGWMFLPLLIIIKDREWKDPVKILLTTFVVGWGLFIAISRVIIGAHYASDVLFSTGAAAIITILLYKWFYLEKQN